MTAEGKSNIINLHHIWEIICIVLVSVGKETERTEKRKSWVTVEILDFTNERRKLKKRF